MYNSSTIMARDKMVLQLSAQTLVYYAEGKTDGVSDFSMATRFNNIEDVIRVARKLHLTNFLVHRERHHVYDVQLEKSFIVDECPNGALIPTA